MTRQRQQHTPIQTDQFEIKFWETNRIMSVKHNSWWIINLYQHGGLRRVSGVQPRSGFRLTEESTIREISEPNPE